MTIFGREPAFWVGLIASLILGVISTLLGQGVISDALAGKAVNLVNAVSQLVIVLAPLLATLIVRQGVTPVAAPVLPIGQPVTTPSGSAATVAAGTPTTP